MERECTVCYCSEGSFRKLACGHEFCSSCIKNWYLKGTGASTSCPMCRRPIHFKGFQDVRDEWDEEAWENRCAEVFSEALDECAEEAREFAEHFGSKMARKIMSQCIDDFKDIERTYNFLKSRDVASEDIEYVLFETDDYFSDRHLDKCVWIDEPPKESATRYPRLEVGKVSGSKRGRALRDLFEVITIYCLVV